MTSVWRVIAGALLTLGLVFSLTTPAQAYDGDRPAAARHHTMGGCVHNIDTHVLDCIKGWHKFHKRVHGHRKTFWEPRVSAQHCKKSGCWGRIVTGTMPHKFKLGAKGIRKSFSRSSRTEGSACGVWFAVCWTTSKIDKGTRAVNNNVIKPCVFGSAEGYGGAVIWNLTVKAMFRGGIVTAAQAGKYFTGPAGFAIITVATCGVGVYKKGLDHLEGITFN